MDMYKVQFVGLVYFKQTNDGRHALLPDGREVPDVVSHIATIAVAADDLADEDPFSGWRNDEIIRTPVDASITGTEDRELVEFRLSGDSVEIEGASRPRAGGVLSAKWHDGKLQPLTAGSPDRVSIVPDQARTVADVRIRSGQLRATRFPGSDDDGQGAIISELSVPHPGETVTIILRRRGNGGDGSPAKEVRTITVKNGTEIAIVNASRPGLSGPHDETPHFRIYEQLAPGRLTLTQEPQETPRGFRPSESEHLLFLVPQPFNSSIKCSNTCC